MWTCGRPTVQQKDAVETCPLILLGSHPPLPFHFSVSGATDPSHISIDCGLEEIICFQLLFRSYAFGIIHVLDILIDNQSYKYSINLLFSPPPRRLCFRLRCFVVCLLFSSLVQKLLDRSPRNLEEGCSMGLGFLPPLFFYCGIRPFSTLSLISHRKIHGS